MSATINTPVLVRFDSDSEFLVETEHGDRFVTTAAQIARVLQIIDHEQILLFGNQYRELHNVLKTWVHENRNAVKVAYLASRDHGLVFIVVPRLSEYSREFQDLISDLDLMIANRDDLSLVSLSVMSIPTSHPDALNCFFAQN